MDASDTLTFATMLRDLRTSAGLSQEALAQRAGLSLRGISDLERGARKTPRLETVRLIAAALGLDTSQRDALLALARPRETHAQGNGQRSGALPHPLSTLIGRDAEIRAIERLVLDGARFVTLTGPGGVGKTSLAIGAANAMSGRFADGATYVPLGPLIDPRLVVLALGKALGLREAARHTMTGMVRHALRERQQLLVLDNFEHLMGAATLVADLLASCPGVTVIVTSRERLHLSGEHVVVVHPLPSPDPGTLPSVDTLHDVPAVKLFLRRVREVVPGFGLTDDNAATIAAICHRLDGLPLALELAASWIPVLSPEDLLARLEQRLPVLTRGRRDAQHRHQTLRNAIAWSYNLLTASEQRVFRWMGVFVSGADLESIEAVAGGEDGLARDEVVDIVASLIDKSLLRPDDASPVRRFTMLETIREFALAQLEAEGEHEVAHRRHAAWYVEVGERMQQHLLREVDSRWLDRLEVEHGNLRNALVHTLFTAPDADPTRPGLRLARSIWLFWYYHSHLVEGRWWLEHAISSAGDSRDADHAMALVGLGTIAHAQGDDDASLTWLTRGLEMAREANDPTVTAFALSVRGNWSEDSGHYDEAERYFSEANRIFAEIGDLVNVAITGYHLGVVACGQGNLDEAERRCLDALALSRQMKDSWGTAASLAQLGLVHTKQGKRAEAADNLDQAFTLYQGIGSTERVADTLCRIAVLATESGMEGPAAQLFVDASRLQSEVGAVQALPERAVYEAARRRAMALIEATDVDAGAPPSPRTMQETIEIAHRLLMDIADVAALHHSPGIRPHD